MKNVNILKKIGNSWVQIGNFAEGFVILKRVCDFTRTTKSCGQSSADEELGHIQKSTAIAKPTCYIQFFFCSSLGGTLTHHQRSGFGGTGLLSKFPLQIWYSLRGKLFGLRCFSSSFNSQYKTVDNCREFIQQKQLQSVLERQT